MLHLSVCRVIIIRPEPEQRDKVVKLQLLLCSPSFPLPSLSDLLHNLHRHHHHCDDSHRAIPVGFLEKTFTGSVGKKRADAAGIEGTEAKSRSREYFKPCL